MTTHAFNFRDELAAAVQTLLLFLLPLANGIHFDVRSRASDVPRYDHCGRAPGEIPRVC